MKLLVFGPNGRVCFLRFVFSKSSRGVLLSSCGVGLSEPEDLMLRCPFSWKEYTVSLQRTSGRNSRAIHTLA
ncbi:unnamed protein product [Boreogadus saida]